MEKKNLKFISANLCFVVFFLYTLFTHPSLTGLVAVAIGTLLLFLGTMHDNKKATLGVSLKFGYMMFIATLTFLGIDAQNLISDINTIHHFISDNGIFVLCIISFIVIAACSPGASKKNMYLGKVVKYIAVVPLAYAVFMDNSFFNSPIIFVLSIIVLAVYLLYDLYCYKYAKANNAFDKIAKADRSYWMATGTLAVLLVILCVFSGDYFLSFIGTKELLVKYIISVLEGINTPLFILAMVALACIMMYADDTVKTGEFSDAYLFLSLGGFCGILYTYFVFQTPATLIVLILSAIIYFVFGFSLIDYKNYKNKKNPVYILLNKGKLAGLYVSLGIPLLSVFAMFAIEEGYILSVILLVFCMIIILLAKRIFQGLWIENSIRWQMILATITAVSLSVGVVNGVSQYSIIMLVLSLIVTSIVLWSMNLRDGVWDNKNTISKVTDCVLLGIISCLVVF